jgi:hypothetical protein
MHAVYKSHGVEMNGSKSYLFLIYSIKFFFSKNDEFFSKKSSLHFLSKNSRVRLTESINKTSLSYVILFETYSYFVDMQPKAAQTLKLELSLYLPAICYTSKPRRNLTVQAFLENQYSFKLSIGEKKTSCNCVFWYQTGSDVVA